MSDYDVGNFSINSTVVIVNPEPIMSVEPYRVIENNVNPLFKSAVDRLHSAINGHGDRLEAWNNLNFLIRESFLSTGQINENRESLREYINSVLPSFFPTSLDYQEIVGHVRNLNIIDVPFVLNIFLQLWLDMTVDNEIHSSPETLLERGTGECTDAAMFYSMVLSEIGFDVIEIDLMFNLQHMVNTGVSRHAMCFFQFEDNLSGFQYIGFVDNNGVYIMDSEDAIEQTILLNYPDAIQFLYVDYNQRLGNVNERDDLAANRRTNMRNSIWIRTIDNSEYETITRIANIVDLDELFLPQLYDLNVKIFRPDIRDIIANLENVPDKDRAYLEQIVNRCERY